MSTESFADLGVSRAVISSLSASRDHRAVRDPARRDRRRDRRPRRDREVAHRLGQDARVRDPAGRADRRRGPAPGGAGARADARARDPDRRRHPRHRPRARAARHRGLRRRRPGQAGQGRRHLARAGGDSGPARGPARARRVHAGPDPDADPRRGRPDARHGLSPRDRPDRRRLPAEASDAVLLGHARRRSRTHRQPLRARSGDPPSTARRHGAPTRRSSTGSCRSRTSIASRRSSASFGRDRDLTLVFVRTKHGADRLVKRLAAHGVKAAAMHGNKSQRQREQALARFESGAVDTLVATDVAARGIDVDRNLARDQLRPAGRQRDLRAPHRPHRPRRTAGHRDHPPLTRPAPRRHEAAPANSGSTTVSTARQPPPGSRPARHAASCEPPATRGARPLELVDADVPRRAPEADLA